MYFNYGEKELRCLRYLCREIDKHGSGLTASCQSVAPANPSTYFTHFPFQKSQDVGVLNGPEPGGPESTMRKSKKERGRYSLGYAAGLRAPWNQPERERERHGDPSSDRTRVLY